MIPVQTSATECQSRLWSNTEVTTSCCKGANLKEELISPWQEVKKPPQLTHKHCRPFSDCVCVSMCVVGVLLLLLLLEWRFFRSLTLSLLAACFFFFLFSASPPRLSSHTLRQTLVSLLQSSYRSSTVQRCGSRMPLDSSPPETLWPHVGVMRKPILRSRDGKQNKLGC